MKLSNHQKKIVDKIIAGEVCDIPSYLKVFHRGHEQQYNPEILCATFVEAENGMTYTFKDDHHNFYTHVYDSAGIERHKRLIDNQMTYSLKDNPLDRAVTAQLDMKICPEVVTFNEKTFRFNFLENKYLVADSFLAIKDFVALWSYLRREALIFEGRKPVENDDLSVFFEQVEQNIQPETYPQWHQKNIFGEPTSSDSLPKITVCMVPQKSVNNYIKSAWRLNQDHLAMCEDFVGIKMMATSELLNYRQKGYRTVEERSQRNNLVAAWVAVAISVIAVIIPLFQKSDVGYLDQISQQISVIETQIHNDTDDQIIAAELGEIQEELTILTEEIKRIPSGELILSIEELSAKIDELNCIIEEKLTDGQ